MDFSPDSATPAVIDSFRATPDPRLRQLLEAVTRHLHELVREVEPTIQEWDAAIGFLTATGQACTDTRQEFILLSDVLGVSMLVETINGQQSGTEATVLGPFHLTESPVRALGDTIDLLGEGVPCVVSGQVRGVGGEPVPHATLDIWQATADGFYDVQQPDRQPPGNGRGLFTADGEGRFWFRSVVPSHYPIPTDGPVGALLAATRRHPFRPAHVHFIVAADGYHDVTTHVFVAGSRHIDSDAVFAVKQSLVVDFAPIGPEAADRFGVGEPHAHAEFDIELEPAP